MSDVCIIAMFGATGKAGRETLKQLRRQQKSSSLQLNLYVRSAEKLEGLFPGIQSDPFCKIFEGAITDTELVARCCTQVDTIICTLGENENTPAVTIMEDAANCILVALQRLEQGAVHWKKPKLVLLSSATWNPKLAADRPAFVHWMIKTAFYYPYADLLRAQAKYLAAPNLLSTVFIQPPLLVEDEGSGAAISTESVRLGCSYVDLGEGIANVVLEKKYHFLTAVGVSSQNGDRPARYAPIILYRVSRGMFNNVWYFLFPISTPSNR